jgi:hypothetical protein
LYFLLPNTFIITFAHSLLHTKNAFIPNLHNIPVAFKFPIHWFLPHRKSVHLSQIPIQFPIALLSVIHLPHHLVIPQYSVSLISFLNMQHSVPSPPPILLLPLPMPLIQAI